jgi:hypothetical protein
VDRPAEGDEYWETVDHVGRRDFGQRRRRLLGGIKNGGSGSGFCDVLVALVVGRRGARAFDSRILLNGSLLLPPSSSRSVVAPALSPSPTYMSFISPRIPINEHAMDYSRTSPPALSPPLFFLPPTIIFSLFLTLQFPTPRGGNLHQTRNPHIYSPLPLKKKSLFSSVSPSLLSSFFLLKLVIILLIYQHYIYIFFLSPSLTSKWKVSLSHRKSVCSRFEMDSFVSFLPLITRAERNWVPIYVVSKGEKKSKKEPTHFQGKRGMKCLKVGTRRDERGECPRANRGKRRRRTRREKRKKESSAPAPYHSQGVAE